MLEGHQYTLECAVRNVAPVKNLVVTFYRGRTPLSQVWSHNKNEDKPVDQAFTLNITGSKKEDGVDYYCEAKLEFEMAQPRPMVQSPIFTATVHCESLNKSNTPPQFSPPVSSDGGSTSVLHLKLLLSNIFALEPGHMATCTANHSTPDLYSVFNNPIIFSFNSFFIFFHCFCSHSSH